MSTSPFANSEAAQLPGVGAPLRPQMPTPTEEVRAGKQAVAYEMLAGDWTPYLKEFMATRVQEDRLSKWGPPSTSANTLADMSRQYTTPGLYNAAPSLTHAIPTAARLVGPGGLLHRIGYWSQMQAVQYLAVGIGDMFVCHEVVDGMAAARPVRPHNVYLVPHPKLPHVYVGLWELRLRIDPIAKGWDYFWDMYDLGEWVEELATGKVVETTRPPSFRIVRGRCDDRGAYEDVSNLFGLPLGGLYGETYTWKTEAGRPEIPYTRYRTAKWEGLWGIAEKRDARTGAMEVAQGWTYAGASARDATGSAVIIAGLKPIMSGVQNAGAKERIVSVTLEPGMLMYHEFAGDQGQAFVQQVGPGANLPDLMAYAGELEERQATRWGLSASDVAKSGNDPSSGAALLISRQAKREYATRIEPLFREGDEHALLIYAILLRAHGVRGVPETGYSITYAEIALSPEEAAAEREDIEWDEGKGFISPVTAFMRRNPGMDEAAAVEHLVTEAIRKARLELAVIAARARLGLPPEPPPAPANQPPPINAADPAA